LSAKQPSHSDSKLRCFVAMAFGRDETDKVYDNMIAPLLRKKRIISVRVDRQEHLDDINVRVISELKQCDFAIADLTFARPSVYYEAGFAQRCVPVIFTSRRDHFHPKPGDKLGNFKIHFDLQMKNIIPWSNASDRTFVKRLDRRINYAAGPLVRAKQMRTREQGEINKFQARSLQDKLQRTLKVCCTLLERGKFIGFSTEMHSLNTRFSPTVVGDGYYSVGYSRRVLVDAVRTLNPGWIAWKSSKGTIQAVLIRIARSFGIQDMRELRENCIRNPVYDINPRAEPTKQLVEHLGLCSLGKLPISRVQASMPSFSFDEVRGEFIWATNQKVPNRRMRGFSELYAVERSPMADWLTLLGLVPGKKLTGFHTEGWRILHSPAEGSNHRLIGYLKQVPRHVHIRVFDDIKSEKSLELAFSKWLQDIQVKCV
jgi:hypothetical protein